MEFIDDCFMSSEPRMSSLKEPKYIQKLIIILWDMDEIDLSKKEEI